MSSRFCSNCGCHNKNRDSSLSVEEVNLKLRAATLERIIYFQNFKQGLLNTPEDMEGLGIS